MIRVVIDTNVLVSGLLSPYGPSAQVFRILMTGDIQLIYDERIWIEYVEVLKRKKFKFNHKDINLVLDFIKAEGEMTLSRPLKNRLLDPHDEKFLEVALFSKSEILITGNTRHFPADLCKPVRILTPQQYVEYFRKP